MRLYLGVVPGFFPWVQEPMIKKLMMKQKFGIIFSFWQFRKYIPEILKLGIHDYFSYDGPIMIDSGAYSAHNSGVRIDLQEYLSFISKTSDERTDIIVNLDVVGNRDLSMQNWDFLSQNLDFDILPVIHFPSLISEYNDSSYVGLGGMVPALKINEKGSVFDVAGWVAKLSSQRKQKFHGFGLGSPFHQIAFKDYFRSLDWMGWRRNAAIGDCYTPEGSRSILGVRKSKIKRKMLSNRLFCAYHPPFIDDIELLQVKGKIGWENRALWNVWIFINTKKYFDILSRSSYVKSISRRMKSEKENNG